MKPDTSPAVVRVPGPRFRMEEDDAIRQELLELVAGDQHRIVLDFEEVEFVDSSFLGLLIIVLKRVTASGGDLRICCLREQLRGIFNLMRLDRLFDIYDSQEEAIQSFPQ